MFWFGYKPFASVCETTLRAQAPVGDPCLWCDDPIAPDDNGFLIPYMGAGNILSDRPWHSECHFRMIVGGVNHQAGTCGCFGGTLDADPPGYSAREAAVLAVDFFMARAMWRN